MMLVVVRRDGVDRGAIQGGGSSIVREGERWMDVQWYPGRLRGVVCYESTTGDWMPLNRKPTLLRGSYER